MAPNHTLRKIKKKLVVEIAKYQAFIDKAQEKLDAVNLLMNEEEETPKELFQLPKPAITSTTTATPKRQKGASVNISGIIETMPTPEFSFKAIKIALKNHGYNYTTSTISSTVRKMIKKGIIAEGPKNGKERSYYKAE